MPTKIRNKNKQLTNKFIRVSNLAKGFFLNVKKKNTITENFNFYQKSFLN